MTKDDIDTFEARIEDKSLFQNIALIALSAAIPLGIEKFLDYYGSRKATDLAIVIVCIIAAIAGMVAQFIASNRKQKTETFKKKLFSEDRLTARTFSMVDTGSAVPRP